MRELACGVRVRCPPRAHVPTTTSLNPCSDYLAKLMKVHEIDLDDFDRFHATLKRHMTHVVQACGQYYTGEVHEERVMLGARILASLLGKVSRDRRPVHAATADPCTPRPPTRARRDRRPVHAATADPCTPRPVRVVAGPQIPREEARKARQGVRRHARQAGQN